VLLLVALMTILLVVRPILARLFPAPPSEEEETGAAGPKALAGPDGKLALAGPEGEPAEDERDGEPREEGELAKMMKVAQIEGQVRMDLVEEARQLIDQRTDDVVAVIRDWIDESSKPKKVSKDG
jgi:flagellar biosynthesis/type III secretory pathway M-ring protein FliF/YscJ